MTDHLYIYYVETNDEDLVDSSAVVIAHNEERAADWIGVDLSQLKIELLGESILPSPRIILRNWWS